MAAIRMIAVRLPLASGRLSGQPAVEWILRLTSLLGVISTTGVTFFRQDEVVSLLSDQRHNRKFVP